MKVISTPDYTTWKYEFTCSTCGSELCAEPNDLKYLVQKEWYSDERYGGYYADKDCFYTICPVCQTEKYLIPNQQGVNMSFLLQEKVKKEYRQSKKVSK